MSKRLANMSYLNRFLLCCGILMLGSELWKQWCITFLLNGGHYVWWYFPFQLCSIPMYICLVLPWLPPCALTDALYSFLMDFGLLGGIFAFCDTSGMRYPYLPLTIHSYVWHILLIVIGAATGLRSPSDTSMGAYRRSCCCYLACCLTALILNVSLSSLGEINMFYISPLLPMRQVVFSSVAAYTGTLPSIVLYVLSSLFGALLIHLLWRLIRLHRPISLQ